MTDRATCLTLPPATPYYKIICFFQGSCVPALPPDGATGAPVHTTKEEASATVLPCAFNGFGISSRVISFIIDINDSRAKP
jgi:hypothetical protein